MKQKSSPLQKALNIWAIILIVWSVYRAQFKVDLPIWFDEFIAKPLIFILPVYYYIRQIEKRDFFSGIELHFKKIKEDVLLGLAIGLIFFASVLLSSLFNSSKTMGVNLKDWSFYYLIFYLLLSFATSISEEVLSRGFVLKRLYEDSRNIFSASFFGSILFFFLHVPILFTNDKIVGTMLLRVLTTDLILSFAISLIFIQRRSLIIPIIIHTFYNFSIYLFYFSPS